MNLAYIDFAYIGNLLFVLSYIALVTGGFDGLFGGDDDNDRHSDPVYPGYDPAQYGEEIPGTAGADTMTNPSPGDGIGSAWFLDDGNDTLDGSFDDDYVDAGNGDDVLTMRGGDDVIYAGAGNDQVDSGVGDDTVYGGDGNDTLTGNGGSDLMSGGLGDDALAGGSGTDILSGDEGDDTLSGSAYGLSDSEADTLNGGSGSDTFWLGTGDIARGGADEDTFALDDRGLTGNAGAARIDDYQAGSDTIEVHYDTTGGAPPPVVTVQASANGLAGEIFLDGRLAATVTGGQALTASDISLVAIP